GPPARPDARLDRRRIIGGGMTTRAILVLAVVSACAARHPQAVPDRAMSTPGAPSDGRVAALYPTRTGPGARRYHLGPGDLLSVHGFGLDAMQALQVRVSSTGAVTLPLVGDVPAAGRTENDLRAAIEQKLRNGYMRDPHVSVFVQRFQSQQVSVTGAVARP